jgi:hypothetical protein
MRVNLKKPCKNCPFRAGVDLHLQPGRLEGIIETLKDDMQAFQCHKTTHSKHGGEWDDEGVYQPSGNESVCMGALAYMHREGYLPVIARLAISRGAISVADITGTYPVIMDSLSINPRKMGKRLRRSKPKTNSKANHESTNFS